MITATPRQLLTKAITLNTGNFIYEYTVILICNLESCFNCECYLITGCSNIKVIGYQISDVAEVQNTLGDLKKITCKLKHNFHWLLSRCGLARGKFAKVSLPSIGFGGAD